MCKHILKIDSDARQALRCRLRDEWTGKGPEIEALVTERNGVIAIGIEGLGNKGTIDAYAQQVAIELYEGHLRVLVWADINSESPTHQIDLSEAAIEKYRES